MDPDSYLGLNLENYFPTKNTYDSVIYVHKKFLPLYKKKSQNNHEASDIKKTCDKGQQFDGEKLNKNAYKIRKIVKNYTEKDPVVEQTIRFAETIIPLTIPPSTDVSPTQYTIKAIKKPKKKSCNLQNQKSESVKDATYEKHSRSVFDHFKREKLKRQRDSISGRESISSSQNTLDDINENRTLSCTLSEISERKQHKEDRHCKRNKRNEMQKVAVSESFEAVATECMNTSSDTKIKIHLMNERDKNLFCENIQTPVISALKECFMELKNENLKVLQRMQTSIDSQTKKMDEILNKLTSFGERLDFYSNGKASAYTEASKTTKVFKLEELGADIRLVKETSSDEEELGHIDLSNKSIKDGSVTVIKSDDKNIPRRENKYGGSLGCGENVPSSVKAQLGVKPEKPNRVPARFCWTDATRNN